MSESPAPFRFDGNYTNGAQVEPYLDAFLVEYERITRAGAYPYNSGFKGRVAGLVALDDKNEDTAIYLLQGLRRTRLQAARVGELEAAGYKYIDEVEAGVHYRFLVLVPQGWLYGQWSEFEDARLLAHPSGQNARPYMVLRKRARNQGVAVNGRRVLALKQ
jgi:hypothetical protein